jgi:hypothetical protein
MKIILYPVIEILSASDRIFSLLSYNGEVAVTIAGIFAGTMMGAVYFGPLLLLMSRRTARIKKLKMNTVLTASILCLVSLSVLASGEVLRASILLTGGSVGVVLSFIFLGGVSTLFLSAARLPRKLE